LAYRIQCRFTDAIVLRKPADPDASHTRFPQAFSEIRTTESGVSVYFRVVGFVDDANVSWKSQVGMKICTARVLHTVWWPGPASVAEADVVGRMPITRSKYGNTRADRPGDPSIKDGDDLMALADGEGPSRTEIVLDVNDEKCIALGEHRSI